MSTVRKIEHLDGGTASQLRGDPITGERYYSKEFAQKEWDHMWTRIWHIAGRESELEQPGDFIQHRIGFESVLAVRQKDGGIRAFYNACQHRAARLTWADQGHTGSFDCPYHGWKYDLDGTLIDVQDPDDFENGNPCGNVSLTEVRCDTWGGFVWYTMDDKIPDLMDWLDPIPELLKNRKMDRMVRVVNRRILMDANWKFASDNFNESYHLPTVHPELATNTDEDYKNTVFEMYPNGHNRMIEQGQPSMRAPHPNEVEAPWDDMLRAWDLDPADFAGRARDGRLALQQQKRKLAKQKGFHHLDDWDDDELTDYFHHTLFPNVTMTAMSEGVHFFRTEPDPKDPEKCYFDYWCLAPVVEGASGTMTIFGERPYEEAELEVIEYGSGADIPDMAGSFLIQDLGIAVGQQMGFHSRGYSDAILSGQESRVRRFHEVLNDYIEGRR